MGTGAIKRVTVCALYYVDRYGYDYYGLVGSPSLSIREKEGMVESRANRGGARAQEKFVAARTSPCMRTKSN